MVGLIDLPCSRNARSRKTLAREKARLGATRAGWVKYRAQWETYSGLPLGKETSELGWTIGDARRGRRENATQPPHHTRYKASHRGRSEPGPGGTARIRRGCHRSREWRNG